MNFEIGQTHQIAQPTQEGMKIYKIHILAIVDECQIVFKWYGKHKQWWHYEVEDAEILEMKIESAKRLLTPRAPDAGDSAASTGSLQASAESTSQTETAPTQRR